MTAKLNSPRSHIGDLLTAGIAPLVWGSTYLVTTEFLPPGRPFLAATVRALPAGLLLVAGTRQFPRGVWLLRALVLGTLNIGAFFTLLFVAAYRLPGGLAAIIGSVQPVIVILLAMALLRQRARLNEIAACVLGTAGVSLLVLTANARLDTIGVIAELCATACMAGGIVLGKLWGRPEGVGLLAFTGWQLTAGGILLLPLTFVVEGMPAELSSRNLLGFGYLMVVGSMISYFLWFRGIERLPAVLASMLGFVSPLVATILGFLVLGQGFTLTQGVGAVAVFAALHLAQRTPAKNAEIPSAVGVPLAEAVAKTDR